MKFYAVKAGRVRGVYTRWKDAERQVLGFKGAQHPSFSLLEEAEAYMREGDDDTAASVGRSKGVGPGGFNGTHSMAPGMRKCRGSNRFMEVGGTSGTQHQTLPMRGEDEISLGGSSQGGLSRNWKVRSTHVGEKEAAAEASHNHGEGFLVMVKGTPFVATVTLRIWSSFCSERVGVFKLVLLFIGGAWVRFGSVLDEKSSNSMLCNFRGSQPPVRDNNNRIKVGIE
ncbi:hypothetical protein PIB30_053876 [Stylosanthes scabra]|uniref:Ribonuclease H1 N-terminal domain-containing protein n=1 Tax=Stylosanthes scabra TaxID=79078 RepID=A0ABU6SJD3_9FABA|nr:hypothetical protein [Stylosanthes scabra]